MCPKLLFSSDTFNLLNVHDCLNTLICKCVVQITYGYIFTDRALLYTTENEHKIILLFNTY